VSDSAIIERSESVGDLLAALTAATLEFPEIEPDLTAFIVPRKEGARPYQYDYASLRSVNKAIRQPLAKHGLVLLHGPRVDRGSVVVRTELWHLSQQWFAIETQLPVETASPQAVQAAVTYGKRYNVLALLNLSPGAEDDDAASASGVDAVIEPKDTAPPETATVGQSGDDQVVTTRQVRYKGAIYYGIRLSKGRSELWTDDRSIYDAAESARLSGAKVSVVSERREINGRGAMWIVEWRS